ncbi:MAG: ORF6N domain-containing protein, partial [bacterium]
METEIPVKSENISLLIHFIRGKKVLLDFDLADLYEVKTKNLNLAVKRNINRFPPDFMFQLTKTEWEGLRLQFETSNGRGGKRYLPYAFTEQGLAMLSGILNSDKA